MDFFTQLEKRLMELTPGSDDYDRFVSGIAVALDSVEQDVHVALEVYTGRLEDENDLLEFYIEELGYDFQRLETTVDSAEELALALYFNIMYGLCEVQQDATSMAALKKRLTKKFNAMLKEYTELFEIEESIRVNAEVASRRDNVIQFKLRGKKT